MIDLYKMWSHWNHSVPGLSNQVVVGRWVNTHYATLWEFPVYWIGLSTVWRKQFHMHRNSNHQSMSWNIPSQGTSLCIHKIHKFIKDIWDLDIGNSPCWKYCYIYTADGIIPSIALSHHSMFMLYWWYSYIYIYIYIYICRHLPFMHLGYHINIVD